MTNEETAKKGKGCLFFGCLTVVVLVVVVAGALTFGIWKLKEVALSYTDTRPLELERVSVTPDELREIKDKMDAFSDALKTGNNTGPLVLTATEVNALIGNHQIF